MSRTVAFLFMIFLSFSCASRPKVLKEVNLESPHHGHLYKMDDTIIEVTEIPTHRLKFYFYTLGADNKLTPMEAKNVQLQNGYIDPTHTKQNFSIIFVDHKTYIEGIVEKYEIDPKVDVQVLVDVKIGSKKRKISVNLHNE